MTRIFTLIIIAIAACVGSQAQVLPQLKREKPDLAAIRQATLDRTSPYYYPRLMKEFQRNDTLMKIDKFRHLYLGYMFQEDYNPYRSSERTITYDATLNRSKELTRQECDSVIAYAEQALADNPFNLGEMVMLINALRGKGKNNLANIWQYKLNHLVEAIVSTGTGLDEENAWIVINPMHEYNLINFQNHVVDAQEDRPPYYDYITIKDADKKDPKGFYFDVRYLLEEYNRKFPEQ